MASARLTKASTNEPAILSNTGPTKAANVLLEKS
jgi:hypothetical protein